MKAIETAYAGCRFRSRTEARWAVLFDALGIRWEYEKEGYELPSGRYLPDFWLPDFKAWVEIKGTSPTRAERKLIEELIEESGLCAAIVFGTPDLDKVDALFRCMACGHPDRRRLSMLDAAFKAARGARFEHGEGVKRQPQLGSRLDKNRDRWIYPMANGDDWVVGESDDGGGSIWVEGWLMLSKPLAYSYALLIAMFCGHDLIVPEFVGGEF